MKRKEKIETDRPLPAAPELEEAVLGALLSEPPAFWDVADILRPEMFSLPTNAKIYQVISEMHQEGHMVDLLTVTDRMRNEHTLDQVGGALYLTELTSKVVTALHVVEHALIIKERAVARKMITAAAQLAELAYGADLDKLVEFVENDILHVGDDISRGGPVTVGDAVATTLREIEKVYTHRGELSGITSGLASLDCLTCGWQPSDLIILAARPSMGKTSLALQFAYAAASSGIPVGFFSLEMSAKQIATRLISRETSISPSHLRGGKIISWADLDRNIKKLVDMPLYIDDTSALTLLEFRSKARRWVGNDGVKLLILDYLQLMQGESKAGNREQEISSISRALKATAKELNVPVIACSQLNRSVELRADKRPLLSDLRESGAIEQDADLVIGILRPEYYGLTDPDGGDLRGITQIEILKQRNGPVGQCQISHSPYLTKYFETNIL